MATKFVDMKRTDEEKRLAAFPGSIESQPDYPWGLTLRLTEEEMEKLDLDTDCQVGDFIDFRALAQVTSVSMSDSGDGTKCCVELGIRYMAAEDEGAEDPAEG